MTTFTILASLASVGLSALAGVVLGAWVYHCGKHGRSPVPSMRPKWRADEPEDKGQGERLPTVRA